MSKTTTMTIRDRINSDAFRSALAEVLPSHVTPERMARVALTALTRTPGLADCDQKSFFKCLMDLSAWGLEPDGRNAHLIPFKNNRQGIVECQLIIDYKGLVELAFNSGKVKSIHADVVRSGDRFEYDIGQVRHHVPWFLRTDDRPDDPGEVIAAYCVVQLKDGATTTEVLSKDEIESIRARSRAGRKGPWVTDWCEMAKKTAFRRASKWIPLAAEVRDAMDRDDDRVIDAAPRTVNADQFRALVETPEPVQSDAPEVDRWLIYDGRIREATVRAELDALRTEIEGDGELTDGSKAELIEFIDELLIEFTIPE